MYIKKHNKDSFLSIHHKKISFLKKKLTLNKHSNKQIKTKELIKYEISKNLKSIINYIDTKYSDKLIHISLKMVILWK